MSSKLAQKPYDLCITRGPVQVSTTELQSYGGSASLSPQNNTIAFPLISRVSQEMA